MIFDGTAAAVDYKNIHHVEAKLFSHEGAKPQSKKIESKKLYTYLLSAFVSTYNLFILALNRRNNDSIENIIYGTATA